MKLRKAPSILLLALIAGACTESSETNLTEERSQAPVCIQTAPPAPRELAEEALARSVADAWIERHPPQSMGWDWGPAVLAYGMLDLYEATGDASYRAYVTKWIASHDPTYPMVWSDTVAPAASAARLARWSCDEQLLSIVERTSAYLSTAPRTQAGGIGHLGFLNQATPQLWVDSLFMFGSFLMARGELYGTASDWDLYAEQIDIFADELQDAGGFFRHALINEAPWPESPVFWGRGNAWVANIVSRFLLRLPEDHPRRARVEEIESDLLEAVLAAQTDSGLWWTVLDGSPPNYLETSASALFADGLLRGAKLGLIGAAEAEQAYAAAASAVTLRIVDVDGKATVRGTSTATQPGGHAYYYSVPQDDDVHYGVGAVLLMLTSR